MPYLLAAKISLSYRIFNTINWYNPEWRALEQKASISSSHRSNGYMGNIPDNDFTLLNLALSNRKGSIMSVLLEQIPCPSFILLEQKPWSIMSILLELIPCPLNTRKNQNSVYENFRFISRKKKHIIPISSESPRSSEAPSVLQNFILFCIDGN